MLELEELDAVFANHWLWSTTSMAFARFRKDDHLTEFRSMESLRARVLAVLRRSGVQGEIGAVRLLTQLRYLGFAMNPVSFFYCYDLSGSRLVSVIAEVNNTPWGQQHVYVIPANNEGNRSNVSADEIRKTFHVSPFMPMQMSYRMTFSQPAEKLGVRIENQVLRDDETAFGEPTDKKALDVTMVLNRKPLTSRNLHWMLVKYPLVSFKIFVGIYWQAILLYLKKIPFYPHPGKAEQMDLVDNEVCPGESDSNHTVESDSETVLVSR
jgi:DUF1365 family protein